MTSNSFFEHIPTYEFQLLCAILFEQGDYLALFRHFVVSSAATAQLGGSFVSEIWNAITVWSITGWWFGTWLDYDFPFSWEFHHPNWRTHIFQRVWNHKPDHIWVNYNDFTATLGWNDPATVGFEGDLYYPVVRHAELFGGSTFPLFY